MKEEINSSAGNLKTIRDRAAPPHQTRYLQEYRQHHMASDSSSRSSFSVLGSSSTTGFSAVGSQASFSDSSRTYHPSDGDRRSTSPPSPLDEEEEDDDDVLDVDDSDERNTNRVDMDSLRHRGKGEYRCPYWRTCQKGGQNINGGPKIFHRNCMYRYDGWVPSLRSRLIGAGNTCKSIPNLTSANYRGVQIRTGSPGRTS